MAVTLLQNTIRINLKKESKSFYEQAVNNNKADFFGKLILSVTACMLIIGVSRAGAQTCIYGDSMLSSRAYHEAVYLDATRIMACGGKDAANAIRWVKNNIRAFCSV